MRVSKQTKSLLERIRRPEEQTHEQILTRLIREEVTVENLEEFVTRYIPENPGVVQIRVANDSVAHSESLDITAHVPPSNQDNGYLHEGVWKGIHLLEIDGELYRYHLTETSFGPEDSGSTSLYVDNAVGLDDVAPEVGCEMLKQRIANESYATPGGIPSRVDLGGDGEEDEEN